MARHLRWHVAPAADIRRPHTDAKSLSSPLPCACFPSCSSRFSLAPGPGPGGGAGAHQGHRRCRGRADNQLIGYGLVVGLNGTGDKLNDNIFTLESLVGMLERLGVNTRDQIANLTTKDVAAVMVTAELPAFARTGSRIDVTIGALGDATNLTGGILLVTPLLAADGEVYAVAQGALATGAIAARGAASSVSRGVPTAGRIANGASVEREVGVPAGQGHRAQARRCAIRT